MANGSKTYALGWKLGNRALVTISPTRLVLGIDYCSGADEVGPILTCWFLFITVSVLLSRKVEANEV